VQVASGSRLGAYEILELIGEGGMGAVYRARDSRLERDVALKLVHPHLVDAERAERFRREARVLAVLGHPNVASVYELDEAAGTAFIVMELVHGQTLADLLSAGPLPTSEVLRIASQVAAALEAVHDKGLIHRDLKPANIKLTADGVVKVLDFGLAKSIGVGDSLDSDLVTASLKTREGVIAGTVAYMSPEQARGHEIDRRCDIWAFGCVVYEMLTGRPAFGGRTTADTIAAVMGQQLDWDALPLDVPPALARVLRRCLQRDVKQRLRDMGDARLDIEETATAPALSKIPRASSGVGLVAALGLAAGALALGALAALMIRAPSQAAPPPTAHFVVPLPAAAPLGGLDFPSAVISPDGTKLVHVASRGGQTQLFVRAMDEIEPAPIPGTANAVGPFFSPDSQWVAFFADGQLKKVALSGGAPLPLGDAPVGLGGSWGPGDIIVFAAGTGSGLSQVPAAGGAVQRLTTLDVAQGEFSHRWPQWLPDGETVLYTVGTSGSWSDALIVAQSLESGRRSTLVRGGTSPQYLADGSLLYAQNGRIMRVAFDAANLAVSGPAVAVLENVRQSADGAAHLSVSRSGIAVFVPGGSEAGQSRLVSVNKDGTSTPFAAMPAVYAYPRVSPNGRRLVVTMEALTRDLWVYDFTSGQTTQLTFDGSAAFPVWSPDAQQVAYSTTRVGVLNLFRTTSEQGGRSERIAASENQQFGGSWAPDGTLAFSEQRPTTGRDILLLSPRDRVARPLLDGPSDESSPRFSHDGRLLAYVSNETGRAEVYVTMLSGPRRARPVSSGGGEEPVWASGARELYFREGKRMMEVAIGADGQALSQPRVLFEGDYAQGSMDAPNYDTMPDGRFVMVLLAVQASGPSLHVLVNWFGSPEAGSPR